jgi:rhodanese-related sulfurtransferase
MTSDTTTYPIEISVDELVELRQNAEQQRGRKLTILDVREEVEVRTAALSKFVHIPLMDVPTRFQELPTDHALVVLCHHGMRSAQAVGFLRERGYENAINLRGGIDAWARKIDPAVGVY